MNMHKLILAAGLASAAGFAAAQTAYLERAQVLAAGTQIQTFRLPTKPATGAIKYWDMTIVVELDSKGKPAGVMLSSVVPSPKITASDFLAGEYLDPFGTPCTVTTGMLDGGRQEVAYSCKTSGNSVNSGSAVNGPLLGHPFEVNLLAAGMDKISGFENSAWGKVGYSSISTFWSCFRTNSLISARQVGSQLVLNNFGDDNLTDCGITLTLQNP